MNKRDPIIPLPPPNLKASDAAGGEIWNYCFLNQINKMSGFWEDIRHLHYTFEFVNFNL